MMLRVNFAGIHLSSRLQVKIKNKFEHLAVNYEVELYIPCRFIFGYIIFFTRAGVAESVL
jgi:hypothetical protein